MADMLEIAQTLRQVQEDAGKLRTFTQGDEATEVLLGGVPTPTLRKALQETRNHMDAAVQEGIADLQGAVSTCIAMSVEATNASQAAAQSVEDAQQVLVQAAAGFEFFGVQVNRNGRLLVTTGGTAPLLATEYAQVFALPVGARWHVSASGRLTITLGEQ